MTHNRTLNIHAFRAFVLFPAVLAVLIASSAPPQQAGTGHPSAKSSAASVGVQASTPAQVLIYPPLPGADDAQRASAASLQDKKSVSDAPDAGNPLFLSVVTYDSGGVGAESVVVGDVNGDGKLDVMVTNAAGESNGDGSVGVLLGNGDGTFQPAVLYDSGGVDTGWLALADINGDGIPDLVVGNSYAPGTNGASSVGILLGKGDGTFQPVVTYPTGAAPVFSGIALAVGDLNADGKPDIVVTTAGSLDVLMGNGDGTFQAPVTYSLGGFGVAIADVNGDGIPDLVVGTGSEYKLSFTGYLVVLLGKGDGTFSTPWLYESVAAIAYNPMVADVNGDGIPDLLAVTSSTEETVSVLLGRGEGLFRPPLSYSVSGLYGSYPVSLAVADLNGDGKPDLAVATTGGVGVLFGNGDGTFQTAVVYYSGGGASWFLYPSAVAVADLNNDGKLDLVAANAGVAYNSHGSVGVLLNNRQGPPYTPTTTALVSSVNPAKLNQSITYTATVTSQSGGAVTGTVTFLDARAYGGRPVAIQPLTGNHASCSVSYSYSESGTHPITASYSGDAANSYSNSSTLLEYAGNFPVGTETNLRTSRSPAAFGQAVTFTAWVTWLDGTVPDGESVAFSDGSTTIGTGVTARGVVTFRTSSLTLGIHTIKATYAGDATFKTSSRTLTQEIKGYESSTNLVSSLNPSIYGQSVTWTATVTTLGSTTPTGNVNFVWEGNSIGVATLDASGIATLTRSNLNADTYPLTAVYSGDTNNAGSTSAILNHVLKETTSAATLSSSANPSTEGQAVTFTATITSPTVTATGPVTFTAGKTVLGTAELSGHKATFTTSTLAVGSTNVTVTYYGDSNIARSSASVTQTVQQ